MCHIHALNKLACLKMNTMRKKFIVLYYALNIADHEVVPYFSRQAPYFHKIWLISPYYASKSGGNSARSDRGVPGSCDAKCLGNDNIEL